MKKLFYTVALILIFVTEGIGQVKKGFDLSGASIPISEIKDGGPPRDGIPSIDQPQFLPAELAKIDGQDRILGVFHNGVAKAYPILILNYHEIVNDYFGKAPVVVTYCPLCGSGIAFDAMIEGERKTFGVSGLLYNSDVLLYDRQTETLWSQLLSEAISGPLKGEKLKKIATLNTTWERWKEMHPKTLLLSEKTGYDRDYNKNPYPGYSESARIYFEVSEMDDSYHLKEMVLGVEIDGKHKAYPFSELAKSKSGEIKDRFQNKDLLIKFDSKSQSARIMDANGEVIPSVMNFWFAWYAFYPETEVYKHR